LPNKKVNKEPTPKLQCQGECKKSKARIGNNFYRSNNPNYQNNYYGGYAPICKNCLRKLAFNKNNTVNMDGLLKALELLDKPYIQEEYIKVLNKGNGIFDLGDYSRNITFCYPKFRYKDSDMFQKKEINNSKTEKINQIDNNQINKDDLQVLEEKWGKGFSAEQYQRLENFYHNFESKYETDLPVEVLNFQNAARTQLQIEKALAEGNITLYNSLIKTLSGIMGDSNVKPVQATGAEANDQLCWGLFVKKAEEEDPIDVWENEKIYRYIYGRTFSKNGRTT